MARPSIWRSADDASDASDASNASEQGIKKADASERRMSAAMHGVPYDADALEALFWACRAGTEETVVALLGDAPHLATAEMGAFEGHDVYKAVPIAGNRRCYTYTGDRKDGFALALHVAAESGHKALCKRLVEAHGADTAAHDYRGRRADAVANGAAKEAFLELAGKTFAAIESYDGEADDSGAPHGKGTLTRKSPGYDEEPHVLYVGSFHAGRYHGSGALYRSGGTLLEYEGRWVHGVMHGKGRCYDDRGNLCYDGHLRMNKRHGFGKAYDANRCVYQGRWRRGLKHGYGRLEFVTEDTTGPPPTFEGSFRDDKMCGAGTYVPVAPFGDRRPISPRV